MTWQLRNVLIYFTDYHECVSFIVATVPSFFTLSWLITRFLTTITPWVSQVQLEFHTFLEHLGSTRFLVGCVLQFSLYYFVDHGLSFIMPLYYFNLRFWLPVSYLQAFRKLKCQSILLIILTYKLASSFLISWKVNWRYLATMSTYDILLGFIIRAVPIFVDFVFH